MDKLLDEYLEEKRKKREKEKEKEVVITGFLVNGKEGVRLNEN